MPTKSHRNQPVGPIDGIRRTQKRTVPASAMPKPAPVKAAIPVHHGIPERPLPQGLTMGHGKTLQLKQSHSPIDTGELITHPSLPLPSASSPARGTKSSMIRQVIGRSFHVTHDKRSTRAILIATLISPTFWLFLISPWVIEAISTPGSPGWNTIASGVNRILNLSFSALSGRLLILGVGLFLIWVGRHALLLVSHAVHVRQIDHRLSDSHAFWWAAIHKLSRSFTLGTFDLALSGAIVGSIVGTIIWIGSQNSTANLFTQGLILNVLIVFAGLIFVILSVHRPLARVMLASTGLTAWQLVKYSFGMIIYNFGRTLVMGIWWLIMVTVTVGLLAGISWATISYGIHAAEHALIGKILLGLASAGLMYVVLAAFLLWNQGYWSLAYHYLAHRTYPAQVSRFFTTEPHRASRRSSLIRVVLITIVFGGVLFGAVYVVRQPLGAAWQRVQDNKPAIQDWLRQQ